ncbi:hypothetical protein TRAPUB_3677 [Trametes pubescens]|uniref:Uncharacterized protein n=1 Tax=Trametes pubescens TaxID=154538 RepID=A0A1M2VD16_TRAPU|nr:hypothetical protein TRAPUB_3677 [Trametes pubescens]
MTSPHSAYVALETYQTVHKHIPDTAQALHPRNRQRDDLFAGLSVSRRLARHRAEPQQLPHDLDEEFASAVRRARKGRSGLCFCL